MTQQNSRVSGLDGLASLKDMIATVPSTEETAQSPTEQAVEQVAVMKPQAAAPVQHKKQPQPQAQNHAPKPQQPIQRKPRVHGNLRPQEEAAMVRSAISREMPSLEEYIEVLQAHVFSFTVINVEHLNYFIDANREEVRLHQIAWAGGDMYMIALQRAMSKALHNSMAERAHYLTQGMQMSEEVCAALGLEVIQPKKPKHNHPPKQHKSQVQKPQVDQSAAADQ